MTDKQFESQTYEGMYAGSQTSHLLAYSSIYCVLDPVLGTGGTPVTKADQNSCHVKQTADKQQKQLLFFFFLKSFLMRILWKNKRS